MNIIHYIVNQRVAKYTQGFIFIMMCVFRLVLPISNVTYLNFLYSIVIFTILPLGVWGYIQKSTMLFESSYIRIRLKATKISCFFTYLLINDLIVMTYVFFNALLMLCLSFQLDGSFLLYFFTDACYWLCIYLLFITVFHIAYYFGKEFKNAFFSSYALLLALVFTTDIVSPGMFMNDLSDYSRLPFLIMISLGLLLLSHLVLFILGKGACEVYEETTK